MPGNPIKSVAARHPHVMPGAATLTSMGHKFARSSHHKCNNVLVAPTFEHCGEPLFSHFVDRNSNLLVQLCNVFFYRVQQLKNFRFTVI